MANDDALRHAKLGTAAWNTWRTSTSRTTAPVGALDLGGADLRGCTLVGANLAATNLSTAQLEGGDLSNADFENAVLDDANLEGANLNDANFRGASLQRARLGGATLFRCKFPFTRLEGAVLRLALLAGSKFESAKLRGCDLTGAILQSVEASLGTDLSRANLSQADLSGARITDCFLAKADLSGVKVDDRTAFDRTVVEGCRIERRTLESLDDYGGLTRGAMMTMKIIDPVAKMRSHYSGFWQWLHLVALTIFLAPYAVFITQKYALAHFNLAGDSIALWEALARFIWTGGTNAGFAAWPFVIFCYSVTYNVLRAVLLMKTKQLELEQQSSGLPANFSLEGGWGTALRFADWGFFLNVALVLWHTLHFMQMRVPAAGLMG